MENENKIEWNKVTWYSKWASLLFFLIVLPILTFFIGAKYQEVQDIDNGSVSQKTFTNNTHHTATNYTPIEGWQTYRSEKYDVEFQYPKDWTIKEQDFGRDGPIAIYRGSFENPEAIISIYPFGFDGSVVMWGTGTQSGSIALENIKSTSDTVLANGKIFKTRIDFNRLPSSWSGSGFIGMRLKITNDQSHCEKNGVEVPRDNCSVTDGTAGSEFKYVGNINSDDRLIQEKIIRSLKFLNYDYDPKSDSV